MDSFQPPPPLLPDLILSPAGIPPPTGELTPMTNCFQKQQVAHGDTSNSYNEQQQTVLPNDDKVTHMMMDSAVGTPSCSSGIQTSWPPATPSSATSTFGEYSSCQFLPPPPSPPQQQQQQQQPYAPSPLPPPVNYQPMQFQIAQPPQLPELPDIPDLIEYLERLLCDDDDLYVLGNSVCLIFRCSIDSSKGVEVCRGIFGSTIMSKLYQFLLDDRYKDGHEVIYFATANLLNLSYHEEGRAAILAADVNHQMYNVNRYGYNLSPGVECLIRYSQYNDPDIVRFAITAMHCLLLDRRIELQEIAMEQISYGLEYIVQSLDNPELNHDFEFKTIALGCLHLLAFGSEQNRLTIKNNRGIFLVLRTIKENLCNQHADETIRIASHVLKALSGCPGGGIDIINNGGISILTHCIRRNDRETVNDCLWTLRNLSHLIINSRQESGIIHLVERLLTILNEHVNDPSIITCALGILDNLTCNNEVIKQFICRYNGVELILNTIAIAFQRADNHQPRPNEILEPAVRALCHLLNQDLDPNLARNAKNDVCSSPIFNQLRNSIGMVSDDLSSAVEKLIRLTRL